MNTSHIQAGLAGCLLMVVSLGAHAQEAQGSCSGLACIFSSHSETTTSAPAPVPVAPPTPPGELNPVADLDQAAKAKPVVKALKPAHAITIAADRADIARLKILASVMPKSNIRFVKAASDDADFTVSSMPDDLALNRKVKLFTDEIHIVAGGAIHTVADLNGKVVSFGPTDGPTRIVAHKAFEAAGIAVKETSLDYANAFDGLATGDIDAVVVLAPAAVRRLEEGGRTWPSPRRVARRGHAARRHCDEHHCR